MINKINSYKQQLFNKDDEISRLRTEIRDYNALRLSI